MKEAVCGIYSITSKHNGKKYIGQSINIYKRWKDHLRLLKKNKHHSQYLQNHYNKYSIKDLTFEVLEEVSDLTLLTEKEQYYMDLFKSEFNACPASNCGLAGHKKLDAKYYTFDKKLNSYRTFYTVSGKTVTFGFHRNETDAIKQVEYLKSLTLTELKKYKEECKAIAIANVGVSTKPHTKNYNFIKAHQDRKKRCLEIAEKRSKRY